MNKLKILLTTMAIFALSVCCCFADDSVSKGKALGLDDYDYYIRYVSSKSGKDMLYTFSYYTISESSKEIILKSCNQYTLIEGKYVLEKTLNGGISFSGVYNELDTNNSEIYNSMKTLGMVGSYGTVYPPQIAPTITEAVQGVLPSFSAQLLNYLPTALLMFSMGLSVPLVVRVIRLFF